MTVPDLEGGIGEPETFQLVGGLIEDLRAVVRTLRCARGRYRSAGVDQDMDTPDLPVAVGGEIYGPLEREQAVGRAVESDHDRWTTLRGHGHLSRSAVLRPVHLPPVLPPRVQRPVLRTTKVLPDPSVHRPAGSGPWTLPLNRADRDAGSRGADRLAGTGVRGRGPSATGFAVIKTVTRIPASRSSPVRTRGRRLREQNWRVGDG